MATLTNLNHAETGLQMRPLGRTDIQVSNLCVGTMMYGEQMDQAGAFEQMDACFERGLNFYDTAEMYTIPPRPETQGNSERILGQWVKDRGIRDKVVLASKVAGRSTMTYLRDGNDVRLEPSQIRLAIERSLENLKTDCIDLYQLHWPDRTVPIFGGDRKGYRHYPEDYTGYEEVLRCLEDICAEGKVRHFGLSNETSYGTMKYLTVAEKYGLPRMASIQNCYNLVNRYFEYGLSEIAMEEQVGLLAYSPIAQGVLSGKYLDGKAPSGSRKELFGRMDRYDTAPGQEAVRAYVQIARDFGYDPAALAMQFVTTRPWVTSNIFGASSMEQLDTIFASLDIEWTDELGKAVNAIHEKYPNPCP